MEEQNNQNLALSKLPPAVELRIRRGFIGEITIHQVTDEELELLTNGYSDTAYLNYSIFLLSVAISLLTALLTTAVTDKIFTIICFYSNFGIYNWHLVSNLMA